MSYTTGTFCARGICNRYRSLKPNPSAARLLVAIILLLSASVSQAQTAVEKSDGKLFSPAARLRPRISLNAGWKFIPGDVEAAESFAFDEHNWTTVDLPHTWNGADTLDDEPGYRRGVGWYRKNLYLERRLEGRRLFLYFEGANQVTDVFVNGKHAGQIAAVNPDGTYRLVLTNTGAAARTHAAPVGIEFAGGEPAS